MSDVVIKVENLSKQYRLGTVGTGTLSHDLNRFWAKMRGKEDPYLKIGEANDRTQKGESEYVWALKDINFEVKRGEVLGIIGRNGAGKSTLLKILSQITRPTTGSVKMKGRVGSLLEVGTGFHPDLTGRENIYINGAILGMRKWEIDKKLDEIIDFAGVEKYIDTPVKRYSTGMKVRLGFSVAAYLEPEILIVDEVLAVGDIEFQRKCLGKMDEVSKKHGRTILFVSHDVDKIEKLCQSLMILDKGGISHIGEVSSSISAYLIRKEIAVSLNKYLFKFNLKVREFNVCDEATCSFTLEAPLVAHDFNIKFAIINDRDHRVITYDSSITKETLHVKSGFNHYDISLSRFYPAPGLYRLKLQLLDVLTEEIVFEANNVFCFKVLERDVSFPHGVKRNKGGILVPPITIATR